MNRVKSDSRFSVFLVMVISSLICIQSCGRVETGIVKQINEQVEAVRSLLAPDGRLDVFRIEVKKKGNRMIVAGEVSDESFRSTLLDSLQAMGSGLTVVDSIHVLPDAALGAEVFGIIRLSVANMRRNPSVRAELVSQTLLGTVVRLLKAERGYYYIQNWDRYLGWISGSSVIPVDSAEVETWFEGPGLIVTANYDVVRERPGNRGKILVDLVPGARLKRLGMTGSSFRVQTPDGRVGYVNRESVTSQTALSSLSPDVEQVVETAQDFLGIPYLWGGTSAKGLDCSGFVQTVFRLNNIPLPRDANQIALEGEKVELDEGLNELSRGDMLFFGSNPERISHCAIYLGEGRYIHSSGWVRINSFDAQDPEYNDRLRDILRAARRLPIQ